MNAQTIEILEEELKSANWDLNYHSSKVEVAKIKVDVFAQNLEKARAEFELLKDYTDVC